MHYEPVCQMTVISSFYTPTTVLLMQKNLVTVGQKAGYGAHIFSEHAVGQKNFWLLSGSE
jgi:hypothetical protein